MVNRYVGTSGYLSPELYEKDPTIESAHLKACDIFSFGVVVFCLVSGNFPFGP
jgi:serine/threonine protein kinase